MSDTSLGPGWWQASDGKWYAPREASDQPLPAPPAGPPAKQKSNPKAGRGCLVALVLAGAGVGLVIALSAGGSSGATFHPTVARVLPLDGNNLRVFIVWRNVGKAAGSDTCEMNTTIHNQFGDQVNIRVNAINTNGSVDPGSRQVLYDDIGVDSGDAPYVSAKDISFADC